MKIEDRPRPFGAFSRLVAYWLVAIAGVLLSTEALAQAEQPIAYIGHGAFFDRAGNEIQVTQAFVEKTQAWYRAAFLLGLDEAKKREFAAFEQRLYSGVQMEGQTAWSFNIAPEWLFANSPKYKNDDRTLGRLGRCNTP
jgi:hypothetical protein